MDKITIKVNGKDISCLPGQTIYEVVTEQGLDEIPVLCHSQELEPYASCFVCVVEVAGRPNLLPSCSTKVWEGMEVETKSERVIASRKGALELLMSDHYADCVAPCVQNCPAHVDVQGYIALASMGLYQEAADLIRKTNPLPASCGRVCVRKCEPECRRLLVDDAVAINDLKRYITDDPHAYDTVPVREESTGKKIALVGAGPASLTAAWFLGLRGHDTVIYEGMPETGGMLRYGIPEYRLPKEVLDREVEYIKRAGVEIHCNKLIGRDIDLKDLMNDYDAVFLGMGAMAGKGMGLEKEDEIEGVLLGLPYLIDQTLNPQPVDGTVIVVGGGNTAMDVARISRRRGAEKVIVLYRRTRAEMPADPLEVDACDEEGIDIHELAAPVEILEENGKLTGVRCVHMKLGEPDASGRRRPEPMNDRKFELYCDHLISAIGQEPILDGIQGIADKIEITRWQTIGVDQKTLSTAIPGLFAGGDVETGPSVVIDAIAAGGRAADSIHRYLTGENKPGDPIVMRKEYLAELGKRDVDHLPQIPRQKPVEMEPEDRVDNMEEVNEGLEYDASTIEATRCLSCGCLAAEECDLRDYCTEYGVDLKHFSGKSRKHKIDDRHPYITIDNNKCVLCAKCIRTCEKVLGTPALGLVNRGFSTEMRPAMGRALAETNCISCGNCVTACPTGALVAKKPFLGRASLATREVVTTCGFCSVGCKVKVRLLSEDRFWIEPIDKNGSYLCRFGRFGSEMFVDTARLAAPSLRNGGMREETDWETAIKAAADGLKGVADKHGPESVGVFVTSEATNEEMYLAQLIGRAGIGTGYVGSLGALFTGAECGVLDQVWGFTGSTADRSSLKDADLVICNNTDLEDEAAVLGFDVIDAVRGGAKLLQTTFGNNSLTKMANLVLDPMRGTATTLWMGISRLLIDRDLVRGDEARAMQGGRGFMESLWDYSGQKVSELTGVEEAKLVEGVKLIEDARKIVLIHNPERNTDAAAGDLLALGNLVRLLELSGRKVEVLFPRLTANRAGLSVMGAEPGCRPGLLMDENAAATRAELIQRLKDGEIKGALVIGEDPLMDRKLAGLMGELEFLTVMDVAMSETAVAADVVLPGSNFLESTGTRINFEGEVREFAKVLDAPAGKQGWEVLADLHKALTSEEVDAAAKIEALMAGIDARVKALVWNKGEDRSVEKDGRLLVPEVTDRPLPAQPVLTQIQNYKREVRAVGIDHFKVRRPRGG